MKDFEYCLQHRIAFYKFRKTIRLAKFRIHLLHKIWTHYFISLLNINVLFSNITTRVSTTH